MSSWLLLVVVAVGTALVADVQAAPPSAQTLVPVTDASWFWTTYNWFLGTDAKGPFAQSVNPGTSPCGRSLKTPGN